MMSKTLYDLCVQRAVALFTTPKGFENKDFRNVPNNVLFDFYHMMCDAKELTMLAEELADWSVFSRMLTVKQCRVKLLKIFQSLIDASATFASELVRDYGRRIHEKGSSNTSQLIEAGLDFSVFLVEGAWYQHAHDLLQNVHQYIIKRDETYTWRRKLAVLECLQRRLYVEANYALFDHATATLNSTLVILHAVEAEAMEADKTLPNLASLYATYAHLFTLRSEYDEAFKWCMKAIDLLNSDVPRSTSLFVMRIVAKVCVVKRRYAQANFLIQQALMLAKELYQVDMHPNYADTLMVYGFFLLNYDNIAGCCEAYQKALDVREAVFGTNNLHVVFAYEELAYAHYANEYGTRDFQKALDFAEKASKILHILPPHHHLALSYTKRVKGLILEEIALDMREPSLRTQREALLEVAEVLHSSALRLSLRIFGENNVQTAKHYGNLGRVYQSMNAFEKAERMQLLAISIKENILGPSDYEVGLSIGHLASLYNFHMARYEDAEKYYLRSIQIGKSLFGESYSGLEYDYRGLIKVYTQLDRPQEVDRYREDMRKWREMRMSPVPIKRYAELLPVSEVVQVFLNWNDGKEALRTL